MAERTKLIQARLQKHWTQEQAANLAGVSVREWRGWEKGAMPHLSSIECVCELFGVDAFALGFGDEEISEVLPPTPHVSLLTGNDLLMRLLAIAFLPMPYQVAQRRVATILEEHDAMKDDNVINRRTALTYLAKLPFVAALRPGLSKRRIDEIIPLSNAGIAALWALSKSGEDADLQLSFMGAADYAAHLKPVVKEASSGQQRQAVAELVAQVEMLQTVLGWHRVNPLVASQHGTEAVKYAEVSGDVLLHLNALKLLTWAYVYGNYPTEALETMQKARLVALQHRIPPQAQSGVESTFAIAQAFNGGSVASALTRAEQGFLSKVDMPDYMMDPIAAHFTKSGLALYLARDYQQAMNMLTQVVDPESLELKHPLPERFRVEALNTMILSLLKQKDKDKERLKRYWQVAMQGTLGLQSKQRLNEAVQTYSIMEALWPDDTDITEKFRAMVGAHMH